MENNRKRIIGVGVGCGLSARAAEKGGADFLATYHTAMYRIMGLPTILSFLPYDNCNDMVFERFAEIKCNVNEIPILAGLGAHDPRNNIKKLVEQALKLGAGGVVNEPFLGSYGTMIRQELNRSGLGFSREVEMLQYAIDRDAIALGWSFSLEEAKEIASIGSQYVGLIVDEITVPKADTNCVIEYIDEIEEKVRRENPQSKILLHGRIVEDTKILNCVLENSRATGFFTGSTGERIPMENGMIDAIHKFKTGV